MISVVILARNGAKTLDRCLSSVFVQKVAIPFDVIVIDSGSSDGSLNIYRKYPLKIIQIHISRFNYGSTRNYCLQISQAEYIVFLSVHSIPVNDCWLHELVDPMVSNRHLAGVYSQQLESPFLNSYEAFVIRNSFGGTERCFCKQRPCQGLSFSNSSSAVRRAYLERFPFKELPFAEDRVWAHEIIEAGSAILYNPKSKVYRYRRTTLADHFQRSTANAVTKRIVSGYKCDPKRLVTKFLNPARVAELLHSYDLQMQICRLSLTARVQHRLKYFLFEVTKFLGDLIGSRWLYRHYLRQGGPG